MKERASILIVDDDEAIRRLLEVCLGVDHNCATAASASEAIEALAARPFDLVLSDITMPGVSGLDLCEHIQSKHRSTIVVMISAMTDIQIAIEALRLGAYDYVTKPFDLSRVTAAVERALRYRDALVAKQQYDLALEERVRTRTAELHAANEDLTFMVGTLYRNYRATLRGLAGALEARDIETRGHSHRVVAYSMRLGRRMGLAPSDLLCLEQGALLHDIGKIGVPDSILLKRGALNTEEWAKMREHVAHGLRIIDGVDFLAGARSVIGQHHEKYDGSGYPNKLRGDAIHMNARIFAVADAYDAMMSDRPYRAAQPYEQACAEISQHAGSHFDPKVVAAFFSVRKEEWEAIRDQCHHEDEASPDRDQMSLFIGALDAPQRIASKLQALCA